MLRTACFRFRLLTFIAGTACFVASAADNAHSTNEVPAAFAAAELSMKKFTVAPGIRAELFAAEPRLANPVAISADERGRVFVAETHRYRSSIFDVTVKTNWLLPDLSFRTVGDRDAFLRETFATNLSTLTRDSERIRLVEDRDGDGRADHSSVFAEGFSETVSGVGAGVLARNGRVWFTCIPDLWRFDEGAGATNRPANVARTRLASGFGVHVGVSGHDLHGLAQGPDGRIYFSSGDRGFVVTNREGKILTLPDEGGVLRCEPDGAKLEIFARGLRNPQELAFNQYGDLFTDDNDTAGPDDSRVIHVVEGGDYGWRASYQFAPAFGPWITENVWRGGVDGTLPYAGLAAQGPSGLAFNPGEGLGARWKDHFFVCDFPGGVWGFTVERRGAGYRVAAREKFLWTLWPTDLDFMPDGALLVADWVGGWTQPDKGRLYRLRPLDRATNDTPALLATMDSRPITELVELLGHADQRVRLAAQFRLEQSAGRTGVVLPDNGTADRLLLRTASTATDRLARIHAIWALGNIARRGFHPQATSLIALGLRFDSDPEIRAQYARTLGDSCAREPAWREAAELARDTEPRVRMNALLSLARLGRDLGKPPSNPTDLLASLARANDDTDPCITHAIVEAAVSHGSVAGLLATLEGDAQPAVRRVALLAHRRMENAAVKRFLADTDPRLMTEAARAINDVPIRAGMPDLAALLTLDRCPTNAVTRAINAAFRLGGAEHAKTVAAYAARTNVPAALRVEALEALRDWGRPSPLDRVMGLWRPGVE